MVTVSDLIREREPNLELDEGKPCKMPVFKFLGLYVSDNDQSSDQSEEHETTKAFQEMDQSQKFSSAITAITAMDDETKHQSDTIEQVDRH